MRKGRGRSVERPVSRPFFVRNALDRSLGIVCLFYIKERSILRLGIQTECHGRSFLSVGNRQQLAYCAGTYGDLGIGAQRKRGTVLRQAIDRSIGASHVYRIVSAHRGAGRKGAAKTHGVFDPQARIGSLHQANRSVGRRNGKGLALSRRVRRCRRGIRRQPRRSGSGAVEQLARSSFEQISHGVSATHQQTALPVKRCRQCAFARSNAIKQSPFRQRKLLLPQQRPVHRGKRGDPGLQAAVPPIGISHEHATLGVHGCGARTPRCALYAQRHTLARNPCAR